MLDAETKFRKVFGYSTREARIAVKRDIATRREPTHATTQEARTTITM
jgi:hypothetical protein